MHIYCMAKVNLQVRLPEEVDAQIAVFHPRSKSDFVRKAIEEKIQRERFLRLEEKWIQALTEHPEDADEANAWLKAEAWNPKS